MAFASALAIVRPDSPDAAIRDMIAFSEGGHLMVLVVGQAPPAPASAYDMVNSEIWLQASQEARDRAQGRADEIERMLSVADRRGAVSPHVAGPVHLADLVAAAGRCADIVLLPVAEERDRGLDRAILNGALFESGTALLTYPDGQPPVADPATAMIAWNATPEGGRAVRAAMPMLRAAREVVLLLVDPQPGARGHGADPGVDIAMYLGHHGISAEVRKIPSEGKPADEVIRRAVRDAGAGVLVMGAYGHARMRERIFGGTTAAILGELPCPVLLTH